MTHDGPRSGPDDTPREETTFAQSGGAAGQTEIGPYVLRERIGAGGMGEVWRAEQLRPIRRTVALKLVKAGMDSEQVIARFEAERQALALMDHPCVAKVFDAGTSDAGRPYFAMEYIRGVPITEHCDTHRLTIDERLALFDEACDGVQHAHQKALIHRDLKPANILVAIQDNKPVPKIIDFGVARAMTASLTEKTLHTMVGQLIGTPEYMSPEQADMSVQDIDTRTDVYSLGVVLYELLSGTLPFDRDSLREKGLESARRTIREIDPPRPSTRVSSAGEESERHAERCRTTPGHLVGELRGDLDWITMKALEKDRTRRYASASELAADVRRYRRSEPVTARPPSAIYRARKFVRRHRIGVAVAAAAAILLAGFLVRERFQASRLAAERDRANEEAATATRTADFMAELLGSLSPSSVRASELSTKEILDAAVSRANDELADHPLVRARVLSTVGNVLMQMAEKNEAETLFEEALALTERELGPDHDDTIEQMTLVAWAYEWPPFLRSEEAESLRERVLEARIQKLGWEHEETLTAQEQLAFNYRVQKRHEEARDLFTENLDRWTRLRGALDRNTLRVAAKLALEYWYLGELAESERRFLSALADMERAFGSGDDLLENSRQENELLYFVNNARHNLSLVYNDMEMPERALDLLTEKWDSYRDVLGDDHPVTLDALGSVVRARLRLDLIDDTGELATELNEARRRVLGAAHPKTRRALTYLVWSLSESGRLDEALEAQTRLLEIERAELGAPESGTLYDLACVHALAGRETQAIDALRQAVDAGYANADHATADPDLASLRELPSFRALLDRMKESSAGGSR